jgi:hypothetical protein
VCSIIQNRCILIFGHGLENVDYTKLLPINSWQRWKNHASRIEGYVIDDCEFLLAETEGTIEFLKYTAYNNHKITKKSLFLMGTNLHTITSYICIMRKFTRNYL